MYKTWRYQNNALFCNQPIGALSKVTLGDNGCASINKSSEERRDTVHYVPVQLVHQECHRQYCKPDQIAKSLRVKEAQADTVTATSTGKHILRGNLILALTVSFVVNQ